MRSYVNEDGLIPLLVTIFLIALVLGGLYFMYGNQKQVVTVESGKCTCEDLSDLRNRLNEVDAAIAEYQAGNSGCAELPGGVRKDNYVQ